MLRADRHAKKDYKVITKSIDDRHRIVHETVDYKPHSKDDPMGLALVGEAPTPPKPEEEAAASESGERYDLDAFNKARAKARAMGSAIPAAAKGTSPETAPLWSPLAL